jgi:hypothetical protein
MNRSLGPVTVADQLHQFVGLTGAILVSTWFAAGSAFAQTPDVTNFWDVPVPLKVDEATYAFGVNAKGKIVGQVVETGGAANSFFFYNGVGVEFKVPNAQVTEATTINDLDDICGDFQTASGWSGFCFSGGSFFTFTYPGAKNTFVNRINNHRTVVGSFQVNGSAISHGFFAGQAGIGVIDIPNAVNTYITDIDDRNDIVGYYDKGNGVFASFFLAPGQNLVNVAIPGCVSTVLDGINYSGDLIGQCKLTNGKWTGFRDIANNVTFFNETSFSSTNTFPEGLALYGDQIVGHATTLTNTESAWASGEVPPWPANINEMPDTMFGTFFWARPDPTGQLGSADGVPLGDWRDVELILQPNGTASFLVYLEVREDLGAPFTCIDKQYWSWNGSYDVQFAHLKLTLSGGQYSRTDNCNPADNDPGSPNGAANYDFVWAQGIAIDGTTYLQTQTGFQAPMDNILFVKQ